MVASLLMAGDLISLWQNIGDYFINVAENFDFTFGVGAAFGVIAAILLIWWIHRNLTKY